MSDLATIGTYSVFIASYVVFALGKFPTASAALRADAAESAVCGYLALIALTGLVVNAVWKVSWADPIAALALLPLIVREGWEARKGKPCCC